MKRQYTFKNPKSEDAVTLVQVENGKLHQVLLVGDMGVKVLHQGPSEGIAIATFDDEKKRYVAREKAEAN